MRDRRIDAHGLVKQLHRLRNSVSVIEGVLISLSFHLVSHFKGIGVKYETSAHFRGTSPMEEHLKSMKREGERNEALISR
jgi:hypothetical protein